MIARDLHVGERVEGPIGAIGRVESVKGGVVRVRYQERGQSWVGIYDDIWFKKYPDVLKRPTSNGVGPR